MIVVRPAVVTIKIAFPFREQVGDDGLKIASPDARFKVGRHPAVHGVQYLGGSPAAMAVLANVFVGRDIGVVDLMQ